MDDMYRNKALGRVLFVGTSMGMLCEGKLFITYLQCTNAVTLLKGVWVITGWDC